MSAIGHNNPPADPFDVAQAEIDGLYDEAKLWLDGEPVATQGQADDLSNLLNMVRAAEKRAEEARKAEKEPHLAAGRAIDAKYKALTERTKAAADAIKTALAPWLQKVEAEKRAAAEAARREAEEKARVAQEALRQRDLANLAEREAAEALVKEAKAAERAAGKAERDTAKASGGLGRAVSLRTVREVEVTDPKALLTHCWRVHRDEMLALATTLAERDVRAGAAEIPGVTIHEKKVAA